MNIARGVAFYLQPFVRHHEIIIPNYINIVIGSMPAYIFISCYLIILFLWIEIYHDISGSYSSILRPIFFISQGLIYTIVIVLNILNVLLYKRGKDKNPNIFEMVVESPFEKALHIFLAVLYSLSAFGFLIYGSCFYCNITREKKPLLLRFRQTVLPKIRNLTILCSICFLFRGALTLWNGIQDWPRGKWWVDPLYYSLLEILPILLMMIVLRPSSTYIQSESRTESSGSIESFTD